jgi:hypothetical protein
MSALLAHRHPTTGPSRLFRVSRLSRYLCRNKHLIRRSSTDFQESGVSDYIATRSPLERRVTGFTFEEFDDATRIAETIKTLSQMKTGYRRGTLAQLHLMPRFVIENAEVAGVVGGREQALG